MSLATLERAITIGARLTFKNPALRKKDIQEWSSAAIPLAADEVMGYVSDPGVFVAIKKEKDKRPKP